MAPLLVESVTLRYDPMGNSPRWKVPTVKESGEKRKKTGAPVPSTGSIMKYITKGINYNRKNDVLKGGGYPLMTWKPLLMTWETLM